MASKNKDWLEAMAYFEKLGQPTSPSVKNSKLAKKQIDQGSATLKARKITNGVDPMLGKAKAKEKEKAKESTALNKVADIVLKRPSQALLAAATYDAKNNNGFLNDLKGGGNEFIAGIKGQRPDATGENYLEARGWQGDGIGKTIAGGALDVLTAPALNPLLKGGSLAVKAALPNLGKVASRMGGASLGGATMLGGEAVAKTEPWKEVGKQALIGATTFPLMEAGLMGAGAGLGKLSTATALPEERILSNLKSSLDTPAPKLADDVVNPLLAQSKTTPESIVEGAIKEKPQQNIAEMMDNPMGESISVPFKEPPKQPKWDGVSPLPETQAQVVMSRDKPKFNIKDSANTLYRRLVNEQQPVFNYGKQMDSKIGKLASNARGVSGIVDNTILKNMVDQEGKTVGESLKSVMDRIPKGREESFMDYLLHKHNIDRAAEGKWVFKEYSPEMSAAKVSEYEAANPDFIKAGEDIPKWIQQFMQTWGVDTGIVSKEAFAEMKAMYKNYIPTNREFDEIEKLIPNGMTSKFADQSTPVRKLKEGGSDRDITNPYENIMELVNRTIRTAKYNKVGQELLNTVRKDPAKAQKFAEIMPTQKGMFNADNVISVLENGKPVYLKINHKPLLEVMVGLPKRVNDIPYLTAATNAVKGTITTNNPIFGITNAMRDVQTSWILGSENNPFKFAMDLGKAAKDVATKSERYQQYQGVGGANANFVSKGDTAKAVAELTNPPTGIKKIWKDAVGSLESFNNMIENTPRVAEFNRVLDRTGDVEEALFAAGEVTVNFGRYGNWTKAVDKAGGMYVNASVQGLDRFFRAFTTPKQAITTIAKSGLIAAPNIAFYIINKDNPYYQKLDNRTKDTYFCIPLPYTVDKNGHAQKFLKIPKAREFGVLFGSLFERVMRANDGEADPFKGFANSIATNFGPANPIDSSIISPYFALKENKDFADRRIVPQGMIMNKTPNYQEYDETTTLIAKKIGEMTKDLPNGGVSPIVLDYLFKSYTGIIAQIVQPATVPGGGAGNVVEKALKNKFVADPLFSNQSTTDFYDKLDKLTSEATEKNNNGNLDPDEYTPEEDIKNSMSGISSVLTKGTKEIKRINATNAPNKEVQVRRIKKLMVDLADRAVKAKTAEEMQELEDEAKELFPE